MGADRGRGVVAGCSYAAVMVRARECAVVLALVLLAGCSATSGSSSPAPDEGATSASASSEAAGPYQPTDDDRSEIRDLLDARARALTDGDRDAFLATVDPEDDDFVAQQ